MLLTVTIETAKKAWLIKARPLEKVIVDTMVMEKAFAYPIDSRLLERTRQHLVKLAEQVGIKLRQNYNRQAQRLAGQVGRYDHANQYQQVRATLNNCLPSWAGFGATSTGRRHPINYAHLLITIVTRP